MSIDTKNADGAANEAVAKRSTTAGHSRGMRLWRTAGPVVVTVLMLAVVIVSNPQFLTGGGPGILALQATFILLVALGQACVLNVGSIDLSNAAMAVLSAMVLAMTLGSLGPVGLIISIALATLIGMTNGLIIAYAQVPSFALTQTMSPVAPRQ